MTNQATSDDTAREVMINQVRILDDGPSSAAEAVDAQLAALHAAGYAIVPRGGVTIDREFADHICEVFEIEGYPGSLTCMQDAIAAAETEGATKEMSNG